MHLEVTPKGEELHANFGKSGFGFEFLVKLGLGLISDAFAFVWLHLASSSRGEVAVSRPCSHLPSKGCRTPRMPLPCGGPARVVFTGPSACADRGGAGREYLGTRRSCLPVLLREQRGGRQGVQQVQPTHESRRVFRSSRVCRSRGGRQGVQRIQPMHESSR